MQAQSSQEQFEGSITRIRSNLSYCRPTNITIKEDVELYRRKLNASYSAGFLRQGEGVSQPNCEIIENDHNWGKLPRDLKTNVIFSSRGELGTASMQPRVVRGPVPGEAEVVNRLSVQLSESNKEIHYLKKMISNSEEGSRIIIVNLKSQIQGLRGENQQLRSGQERLVGELNNVRGGQGKFGECQKCRGLEERIRQLEGYLNEMGGRYEMERQKNAALTANGPNIAPNVVEQLRLVEEKMSKITIEFQRLQGQSVQLKQENWEMRQRDFNSRDEHNRLVSQLQQRIIEFNQTQSGYKRRVFELQREIEGLSSKQTPTKFGKEQLLIENQQIVQELRRERERNEGLKQGFADRQTELSNRLEEAESYINNEVAVNLRRQSQHVESLVAASATLEFQLSRSNRRVEELETLLQKEHFKYGTLAQQKKDCYSQLMSVKTLNSELAHELSLVKIERSRIEAEFESSRSNRRVEELEALLQNEHFKYNTLSQQKNDFYDQLMSVKIKNSELAHELTLVKIEWSRMEAEKHQISLNFSAVEEKLISQQTHFTNELNRITLINEELSQKYTQISRSASSNIDQSHLLQEARLEQRRLFEQQLSTTVDYYEAKLNGVSAEMRREIQSSYMLRQGELQYSIELLREQARKDQESQLQLANRNRQLEIRVQEVIDQSPPSPQKNQYIIELANEQLTNEIKALRSSNEELSSRLAQAEDYIMQQTVQLEQFFVREQSLNVNIVELSEGRDRLSWQLQKLGEQVNAKELEKTVLMMDIDVKDRRFGDLFEQNLQNSNEKANLVAELELKRKESLEVCSKIAELTNQLSVKDQKIAELQTRPISPVKQRVQQQVQSSAVSIGQLTLRLAQIEEQCSVKQQQKDSLQDWIRQLETSRQTVFEQAEFIKAKLIEAEVYIDVLTRERDQLRQQIQELSIAALQVKPSSVEQQLVVNDQYFGDKITQDKSETDFWRNKLEQAEQFIMHLQSQMESKNELLIRANSLPSLSFVEPLQQQNADLQQRVLRLQQEVDNLNSQKMKTSAAHREFKLIFTQLQQQLTVSQLKVIDDQQKIKSLMTQKETYVQRVLDYDAYIKALKQDIGQLGVQYTATEKRTALMTPRVKIFQLENILADLTKEVGFFKDQLMQAESYIFKLESQREEVGVEEHRLTSQTDAVRENQALRSQLIMAENQIGRLILENSQKENQISRLILEDSQKEEEIKLMQVVIEEVVLKLEDSQRELEKVSSQAMTFKRKLGSSNNSDSSVEVSLSERPEASTTVSIQATVTQQNESLKLTLSQIRNDYARLQKEKRDASQRLFDNEGVIRSLESNIAKFTRQVSDSQSKVKLLESDKRNAEQKVRESTASVKAIQTRLQEFKAKAREAEDRIIRLSEENESVGEKHRVLEEVSREAEELRNHLTEAERHIAYMEELRINESQELHIQAERTRQFQQLRVEFQRLEGANKVLEDQKAQAAIQLRTNLEAVKVLQLSLDSERTKLKSAGDQIAILQSQRQAAEWKLVESQKLVQQSNDETTFYKEKLIEAEDYIAYLDSQKVAEEGSKEGKALAEDEERNWLQNRVAVLEEEKRLLQELRYSAASESLKRETLLKDLQQSNNQLNKRVGEAEGRVSRLSDQKKTGEQRLKLTAALQTNLGEATAEIIALKNKVESLSVIESAYLLIKEQSFGKEGLQARLSSLQQQNKVQREQIEFFKEKLLDAQNYITEMQAITARLQEQVLEAPQQNWQQQIRLLENQIKNAEKERKVLQEKVVPSERRAEVLAGEVDFFKKKLLKAEEYITHLETTNQTVEQSIQITVNEGHNEITAHNSAEFVSKIISELKETKKDLELQTINADIRDQQNEEVIKDLTAQLQELRSNELKALERAPVDAKEDGNAIVSGQQVEFFKQKLLEAESYISELQIENGEGGVVMEGLEKKLQTLTNDFGNINDRLVKSQVEKSVLLGQVKELAHKNQQLNFRIEELQELPPYDPEKVQLKSLILSLQRDLENQRQKTSLSKQATDQKQSAVFLKSKLHEAEVYILQLEQQAEPLNIAISSLNAEMTPLKKELQQLRGKLTRASQQKQSCLTDLQKLKGEYDNLKSRVGRAPSQEVLILNEKIYALQEQLQQKNRLHLEEVVELNNHIDELKEYEQSKNAAIDEVMSSNRVKLSKLQEENVRLKEEVCLAKVEVANLTEEVIQAEADREYLRQQNEELTNANTERNEDKVNGGRSDQVGDLRKELQNQLVIYKRDVEQLKNRVRERESEITELYRERTNAEQQLRGLMALAEKLQTEITTLQQKIHSKDQKIDELQTDNERLQELRGELQPEQSGAQFFKQKLLQAESYITELQRENQIFSNRIESLREQMKMRYEEELQDLSEKLTEVERDRVVLFKKVKELQKQLEMQNKVRQEGTEAKDFKGEERVSDIEALTAALSDTEVTVKALEADRISLQKRVEEGQSAVSNLREELTNERQANSRLRAQSKVMTDSSYLLLQEKQAYERQIDALNKRIDELTWTLQQMQLQRQELQQPKVRVVPANQREPLSVILDQEQLEDSVQEDADLHMSNERDCSPMVLDHEQFEDSVQEEADLRKELTRQIESLTVELQKKDEEYIELRMEKFNLQEDKQYLQAKLQSRDAVNEDELQMQRERQAFILQLKGEKYHLIERLQAMEAQKSMLAHEVNRLTLTHREAESKLYEQNSRIQQLEQRLSDEPQLREEVIKGGVRRFIDLSGSGSQQEDESQNEIVRELQPFPYLQELVNSIFGRLKIAQEREEAKTQQLQTLREELNALRQTSSFNERQESQPPRLQREREDLQQLRHQMESDHEQKVNELQVEMDNLQWSQRELRNKLQQNEFEKEELVSQLREAYRRIEELSRTQSEIRREQQELALQNELLVSNLSVAENRIVNLEESQTSCIREEELGETIRKIIELTNNYSEETEEQVFPELESFPYLSELINSILYRLKLSSAIDVEKSLRLDRLVQESESLKWKVEELIKENDSLRQNNADVLGELVDREAQNQELSDRVNDISEQLQRQNQQIRVLERELGNRIPSLEDETAGSMRDMLYIDFLNGCLEQITTVEREVQEVERDIARLAKVQFVGKQARSENSTLLEQLRELQERVRSNAVTLHRQQERADAELVALLTELKQNKSLPQVDKNKISGYLSQLQNSLLGEQEQQQSELNRISHELSASNVTEGRVRVSSLGDEQSIEAASREDLLREINSLNSAVEIYHQESQRRKREYALTIDGLLKDLTELKQKYDELYEQTGDDEVSLRINDLGSKMRLALENDENEEFNPSGEEENEYDIVNGYYTQFFSEDKERKERLCAISRISPEDPNLAHTQVQTDGDQRPFLDYVINSRDLEKEDILLLKKKVSEMRSKQVDENMRLLREQEGRLEEAILQTNGESSPHQIENIILTLAHNRSPEEIVRIFGSEDNEEILKRLNDALYLEDTFVRGQNSAILLRLIEECMLRYYEKPTKLSEDVYSHLISVLVAKTEQELYSEVDGLFRDLHGIESEFEGALRKKDEVYRLHNERMNKIFNRSSSDLSEDYLSGLQGQVEEIEMHISSGHKYRGSDLDSYHAKQ